jgi:two-component sensor histidine kinase
MNLDLLNNRRNVILLVLIAWTLNGILFSTQLKTAMTGRWEIELWRALIWGLGYCYLWAALTPVVIGLTKRFSFEGRRLVPHVAFHIALSLIVAYCARVASELLRAKYVFRVENLEWGKMLTSSYLDFDYGVMMYWFIVLASLTFTAYKKYREGELRSSQLETKLAQAQLQALKMQLHPHFLFNTMNAISVLIKKNPEAAQKMLTRLAELLRMSLDQAGIQEVSLRQEMEFLDRYIKIQQTRFGDRLSVSMKVEDSVLDAKVPNLILQPLVENAIEHGVAKRSGPGRVAITAVRMNGTLHVQVRDNGKGLRKGLDEVKEGVGLSNTRARLQQLYGTAYRFVLSNAEEGGLIATLEIPYQPIEEGAGAGLTPYATH